MASNASYSGALASKDMIKRWSELCDFEL